MYIACSSPYKAIIFAPSHTRVDLAIALRVVKGSWKPATQHRCRNRGEGRGGALPPTFWTEYSKQHCRNCVTVDPRLSGPRLSGTSIIRHGKLMIFITFWVCIN